MNDSAFGEITEESIRHLTTICSDSTIILGVIDLNRTCAGDIHFEIIPNDALKEARLETDDDADV